MRFVDFIFFSGKERGSLYFFFFAKMAHRMEQGRKKDRPSFFFFFFFFFFFCFLLFLFVLCAVENAAGRARRAHNALRRLFPANEQRHVIACKSCFFSFFLFFFIFLFLFFIFLFFLFFLFFYFFYFYFLFFYFFFIFYFYFFIFFLFFLFGCQKPRSCCSTPDGSKFSSALLRAGATLFSSSA